jgi:hypothetical protein
VSPTKLTPDDVSWTSVAFKECPVHRELRYAGEKCPVCAAIEAHDLALGKADYERTQLEGKIEDLEQQIDGYRNELHI